MYAEYHLSIQTHLPVNPRKFDGVIAGCSIVTPMPDYELYYWSVPFRGQFVRAVLAYAGKPGPRPATRQSKGL